MQLTLKKNNHGLQFFSVCVCQFHTGLVLHLYTEVYTLKPMQKIKITKDKNSICSNRQGQQVVNVHQHPEQNLLPLFQLSEWKSYANRSAHRPDRFGLRSACFHGSRAARGALGSPPRAHPRSPTAEPTAAGPLRAASPAPLAPARPLAPLPFPAFAKALSRSEEAREHPQSHRMRRISL